MKTEKQATDRLEKAVDQINELFGWILDAEDEIREFMRKAKLDAIAQTLESKLR